MGDQMDGFTRYDSDPEACAWARKAVQHYVDRAERFAREADDAESRKFWRRHANLLRMEFIGGEGCTITPFDERRSAIVAAVSS